jgi:hypothetical protein
MNHKNQICNFNLIPKILFLAMFMVNITASYVYSDETTYNLKKFSSYNGSNTQTIYLIPTLHCDSDTAFNISKIIQQIKIQKKDKLKLIGLEGSSSKIDTSILRCIPNKKVKNKIIDYYLTHGGLTGAELYDINNPNKLEIYGIENEKQYMKNFALLNKMIIFKNAFEKELVKINKVFSRGEQFLLQDQINKNKINFFTIDSQINKYGGDAKNLYFCEVMLRLFSKYALNSINIKEREVWEKYRKKFFDVLPNMLWKLSIRGHKEVNINVLKNMDKIMNEFYSLADKRNESLVNNILKYMKIKNSEDAILIAGGFHVEGITQILRIKGINYKLIIPNTGKNYNKDEYFNNAQKIYKDMMQNDNLKNNLYASTLEFPSVLQTDNLDNFISKLTLQLINAGLNGNDLITFFKTISSQIKGQKIDLLNSRFNIDTLDSKVLESLISSIFKFLDDSKDNDPNKKIFIDIVKQILEKLKSDKKNKIMRNLRLKIKNIYNDKTEALLDYESKTQDSKLLEYNKTSQDLINYILKQILVCIEKNPNDEQVWGLLKEALIEVRYISIDQKYINDGRSETTQIGFFIDIDYDPILESRLIECFFDDFKTKYNNSNFFAEALIVLSSGLKEMNSSEKNDLINCLLKFEENYSQRPRTDLVNFVCEKNSRKIGSDMFGEVGPSLLQSIPSSRKRGKRNYGLDFLYELALKDSIRNTAEYKRIIDNWVEEDSFVLENLNLEYSFTEDNLKTLAQKANELQRNEFWDGIIGDSTDDDEYTSRRKKKKGNEFLNNLNIRDFETKIQQVGVSKFGSSFKIPTIAHYVQLLDSINKNMLLNEDREKLIAFRAKLLSNEKITLSDMQNIDGFLLKVRNFFKHFKDTISKFPVLIDTYFYTAHYTAASIAYYERMRLSPKDREPILDMLLYKNNFPYESKALKYIFLTKHDIVLESKSGSRAGILATYGPNQCFRAEIHSGAGSNMVVKVGKSLLQDTKENKFIFKEIESPVKTSLAVTSSQTDENGFKKINHLTEIAFEQKLYEVPLSKFFSINNMHQDKFFSVGDLYSFHKSIVYGGAGGFDKKEHLLKVTQIPNGGQCIKLNTGSDKVVLYNADKSKCVYFENVNIDELGKNLTSLFMVLTTFELYFVLKDYFDISGSIDSLYLSSRNEVKARVGIDKGFNEYLTGLINKQQYKQIDQLLKFLIDERKKIQKAYSFCKEYREYTQEVGGDRPGRFETKDSQRLELYKDEIVIEKLLTVILQKLSETDDIHFMQLALFYSLKNLALSGFYKQRVEIVSDALRCMAFEQEQFSDILRDLVQELSKSQTILELKNSSFVDMLFTHGFKYANPINEREAFYGEMTMKNSILRVLQGIINLLRGRIKESQVRGAVPCKIALDELKIQKDFYLIYGEERDLVYGSPTILGGKGGKLLTMASEGLPVPRGAVIPVERISNVKANPEKLIEAMQFETSKKFYREKSNDGENRPLLVSVRSGSFLSMPGALETVLNVGMNDDVRDILEKKYGKWFADDTYLTFLKQWGTTVWDIFNTDPRVIDLCRDKNKLEFTGTELRSLINLYIEIMKEHKIDCDENKLLQCKTYLKFAEKISNSLKEESFDNDPRVVELCKGRSRLELTEDELGELIVLYKTILKEHKINVPYDINEQLKLVISAVERSWDSPQCRTYVRMEKCSSQWKTCIVVQEMVFGNLNEKSCTGVCFTDMTDGITKLKLTVKEKAQGEAVVSGKAIDKTLNEEEFKDKYPAQYKLLLHYAEFLTEYMGYPQDVEFTVEDGKLFVLQTRDMSYRLKANFSYLIESDEIKRENLISNNGVRVFGGAVAGVVCFNEIEINNAHAKGLKAIYVTERITPQQYELIRIADGVISAEGNPGMHAASVAMKTGTSVLIIPNMFVDRAQCIMKVKSIIDSSVLSPQLLRRNEKEALPKEIIFKSGDEITLCAKTKCLYKGILGTGTFQEAERFSNSKTEKKEVNILSAWEKLVSVLINLCIMKIGKETDYTNIFQEYEYKEIKDIASIYGIDENNINIVPMIYEEGNDWIFYKNGKLYISNLFYNLIKTYKYLFGQGEFRGLLLRAIHDAREGKIFEDNLLNAIYNLWFYKIKKKNLEELSQSIDLIKKRYNIVWNKTIKDDELMKYFSEFLYDVKIINLNSVNKEVFIAQPFLVDPDMYEYIKVLQIFNSIKQVTAKNILKDFLISIHLLMQKNIDSSVNEIRLFTKILRAV